MGSFSIWNWSVLLVEWDSNCWILCWLKKSKFTGFFIEDTSVFIECVLIIDADSESIMLDRTSFYYYVFFSIECNNFALGTIT